MEIKANGDGNGDHAAFAAGLAQGKQEAQTAMMVVQMGRIEADVAAIRAVQEAQGKELAALAPLAKLAWAVLTAAILALGASGYAVIVAAHK